MVYITTSATFYFIVYGSGCGPSKSHIFPRYLTYISSHQPSYMSLFICLPRTRCWSLTRSISSFNRSKLLKIRLHMAPTGLNSLTRAFADKQTARRENIYTIPNLLTTARIALCPIIGVSILDGNYPQAVAFVALAGCTDFVSRITMLSFFSC
jgi:hypothetical protein